MPTVQFENISNNDSFAAGTNLEVSVEVDAPSGIFEVKLYINGLRVDCGKSKGVYTWNASGDELLANLKKDWYCLEALAVDKKGFVQRETIYINVDEAAGDKEDWKFDTFKVIQKDGEALTTDVGADIKEYWDKLEVLFMFDSNGKLKLRDQFLNVLIFKTYSKAEPGPRTSEFVDGVITTYNLHEPKSVLWSSRNFDRKTQEFRNPAPAEKGFEGPFEFVVTKGKKIAITGMKNGKRQVLWSQNPDYGDWIGKFSAKDMSKKK